MKSHKFLFSVLLITILTVLTISANAQELAVGIKAGANLANITDLPDGAPSPDMKIGAHIGPFIKLPINDNFSIIPELLYSMKGSKFEESIFGISFEQNTILSYLDIPIMANYQLESGLNFEIGPYVGILLSAKSNVVALGLEEDLDIKDEMNTLDFGIGLGLGYRMESGLGFGARYNLGLATLFKEQTFTEPLLDANGDPILDPNTGLPMTVTINQEAYGKNSNIMISVSWLFGQN